MSVIKVENLSKQYRLGQVGTGTISHDVNRWWHKIRGKEDPYLKIGESNDRTVKGDSDYVWALKDINFEVKQGEVLGIIGRNGAGKSTLLKILSRTTAPTIGSVKIKGRVASLLEVGTGFHPELSGRDNIFLNGAILGMTRREIQSKFDEIVDFAGVERYIDTPVKRYSSGMYVRLAFAVAAHLDPEILIVDEVLAVGDMEFQKKCLGKMKEVSVSQGRTVLFVSHNISMIQKLCESTIMLNRGVLSKYAETDVVLNEYLKSKSELSSVYIESSSSASSKHPATIKAVELRNISGDNVSELKVGEPFLIVVRMTLNERKRHFIVGIGITNQQEININTTWSSPNDFEEGDYEIVIRQDKIILESNIYYVNIGISTEGKTIQFLEQIISFEISEVRNNSLSNSIYLLSNTGILLNQMETKLYKLS